MLRHVETIWIRARKNLDTRRIGWLVTGLIIILSGVILGWMLWHSLPTLLAYNWKLQVLPLIVGLAFYILDLLLAVLGWSIIMKQLNQQMRYREHFHIYCVTLVAGRIPGLPWHLIGRVALYKRHGINSSITSVAAGLEMILIIVSGILAGILLGFSNPNSLQRYLVWIGFVLVIGLGLMHPSMVRKVLHWLGHHEVAIDLRYHNMLALLGLYVLTWGVGGCVFYMIIIALYPLPWYQLPGIIGAWGLSGAVASLISLGPTGFGIREITLSLLLALFIPPGLAVVIAILTRLYVTAAEFSWAIVASRF